MIRVSNFKPDLLNKKEMKETDFLRFSLKYYFSTYKSYSKGVKIEKGKGIALFALNVPLHGCDLLDNRIGRLHTNFQISATLSKKVLIFPPKLYPLPLQV